MLTPILQARARLQHRAGVRSQSTSSISPKLASTIGSAYSVWGLWGTCFRFLASIFLELQILELQIISTNIQWPITLERAPLPTRRLLTIQRTQGWLMLVFSPLSSSPSSARTTSFPLRFPSLPRLESDHHRRRGLAVVDTPLDGVRRAPARTPARRPRLTRQATTRARQAELARETVAAGAHRACASMVHVVQRACCQLEPSALRRSSSGAGEGEIERARDGDVEPR